MAKIKAYLIGWPRAGLSEVAWMCSVSQNAQVAHSTWVEGWCWGSLIIKASLSGSFSLSLSRPDNPAATDTHCWRKQNWLLIFIFVWSMARNGSNLRKLSTEWNAHPSEIIALLWASIFASLFQKTVFYSRCASRIEKRTHSRIFIWEITHYTKMNKKWQAVSLVLC